jgi:uncharacterized membrane protein (DUF485 family)
VAAASSLVQRNSVPSTHMRCMMTASRRANAFAPKVLGTPIGGGVMTVGIPVGLFVIVSAFVLTGIYVHRANSEFDSMTRQIKEKVM